jgi:hypothetical protein
MEGPTKTAVYVTNISPNANEKTVSDFFSFCGKITKLYLKKEDGGQNSSAVVQFETESAAKTALLLTNALIVDRPITVVPYTPTTPAPSGGDSAATSAPIPAEMGAPVSEEHITQRDFGGVPDDERSKTSVVASMVASGYVLGSDILTKAKEYDDKHMISLQAKVALEQIKVKAHEIDKQYGISEKVTATKTAVVEKAKKIDEDYKISEKAAQAANTVKTTVVQTAQKAQENPTVKSGVESLKSGFQKATDSVSATYNDYKSQTEKAIEEKKKERAKQDQQKIEGATQPAPQQPQQPQQPPQQP